MMINNIIRYPRNWKDLHPLSRALFLRRQAKKRGAHPSVVERLNERVRQEARQTAKDLSIVGDQFPIIECIINGSDFKL